ncbi:MAG: DNA-processing protein DprA [Pseudomonadota bacterium]
MSDVAAIAVARQTRIPYALRKTLWEKWDGAEPLLAAAREQQGSTPDEQNAFEILRTSVDLPGAEEEIRKLRRLGGWVLSYGSAGYPAALAEISDPPLVLFGCGALPQDSKKFLGFVGPRRPSTYGARVAKWLATDLAREGVVLVSGLARGIDAIAHESAVRAGVPTVAVVACGLDRTYPPEHALLRSKIEKNGAVVTEFGIGDPPRSEHFPQRNRIISGLSRGVLIIEAGERSGARITARHATEQSREVFAVPGPIDSPLSIIPNRLIAEGAKLTATSSDILEELFPGYKAEERAASTTADAPELSDGERRLLTGWERDRPVTADDLVKNVGVSAAEVLRALAELELKGLIVKQADARYVRIVGEM